jgi:hypothetical protein
MKKVPATRSSHGPCGTSEASFFSQPGGKSIKMPAKEKARRIVKETEAELSKAKAEVKKGGRALKKDAGKVRKKA